VYRDADAKIPASAWRLKRALKVFCFLAAARNHRATKDRVADAVWSDSPQSVIERNFHPTISFLRRALNQGHAVAKNFVLCEGGAYSLNPAYRYEIDAIAFDRAVAAARMARSQGDAAAAIAAYRDAIALYRGAFLEDDDDPWVAAPRAHFETLLDAALREGAELLVRQSSPEQAVPLLERLVERNPSDQEASVVLMQVLGGLGRRSDLEREYRRLQRATDAAASAGLRVETVLAFRKILARTPSPG
jgi:DNA-binding SARP family transcriptional activator